MTTNEMLVLILGLIVRLGLPLLVTLLFVYGLRKLDMHWQHQAEEEHSLLLIRDDTPCWKEQGLSMEEIKVRAAESDKPCWQIHRLPNGYLREACLDCDVFVNAPAPVLKHSKAQV